jgi:flagellar basal body-associated protein FliL
VRACTFVPSKKRKCGTFVFVFYTTLFNQKIEVKMKKSMFIILGLVCVLTACQRAPILSPDSSSSTSSGSSSSSSVGIVLTTNQQATVNAVIASRFPGYSIKEAEQELEHGVTYYKVTIISGNNKVKLLFSSTWQYIGVV